MPLHLLHQTTDLGFLISNNVLTDATNPIRLVGIYVQGVDGASVTGNQISFANTSDASNITGIFFATGVANSSIQGNTISGISGTLGAPRGVYITSGVASSSISINQNTIDNISSTTSLQTIGVGVGSTTGGVSIDRNIIKNIKNTSNLGYGQLEYS